MVSFGPAIVSKSTPASRSGTTPWPSINVPSLVKKTEVEVTTISVFDIGSGKY